VWHFFKEQSILIEGIANLTRKNGLEVLPNPTLAHVSVIVVLKSFQISARPEFSSRNWGRLDTNKPEL